MRKSLKKKSIKWNKSHYILRSYRKSNKRTWPPKASKLLSGSLGGQPEHVNVYNECTWSLDGLAALRWRMCARVY